MTTAALAGAGPAVSTIAMAVQSLYGGVANLDGFFDSHIAALESREQAWRGFGHPVCDE